ncbi:hypothetical protein EXT66_17865 [Pectobacterium carotovorum subsp. carotovorum]|nr:hypothetical protein [Pectobacterium carotovorum]PWD67874.1 hypothetical protein DF215_17875 [Pectobacterium versatile]KHT24421.1 hypothetical protein RC98_20235 [Pectobacterium carotovorum subsp. carotovorum]MCL6403124.1 hypothetical protein [Pectobacterium carotovorum subsp. carotovorum]TAI98406.1 hypothetical protein EG335_08395 [Pectobacterium versatile]TAI98515.1 hypothetical protein EG332_08065 [Pectobacterium versatile]
MGIMRKTWESGALAPLEANALVNQEALSLIYPSYFKLHVRWLRSVTRITYLSKLIGIPSLAAFLKLELFRV